MTLKRAFRSIDLLAVFFVAWGAAAMSPLSWWGFTPGEVVVSDAQIGESPAISFDREIKRPIFMTYSVVVRRVDGEQVVCEDRSPGFTYQPNATLPDHLDLAWWAPGDDRCAHLFPPGGYRMETCWTATSLLWGIVPPKKVCRASAPFTVLPA